MKRQAMPEFSSEGFLALTQYEQALRVKVDLTSTSIRNYIGDVRHFIIWDVHQITTEFHIFTPRMITTPAITSYRASLQTEQRQWLASVNRFLFSLQCYFDWSMQKLFISCHPSAPVKPIGQEDVAPRHLDSQEEQALVAGVIDGALRACALIILLLYTGLQARDICQSRRDQARLGKRSVTLEVIGKYNKHREVSFNTTSQKGSGEMPWYYLSFRIRQDEPGSIRACLGLHR
jgi:site-specific recombinase XerD